MQAQTLITDIRRELVEISASYWTDAELLRHINRAELDFTNKTRILEDTAQLSLVQGRLEYPLPQNWLSARAVFFKVVNSDGTFKWKRLYPTNLEKNSQMHPNFLSTQTDNQGVPSRYWIWNRSLWLDRAPDATSTTSLLLFYKSKPIALLSATDSINLDDSLSEAITAYVLWKAWAKEQEFDRAEAQQLTYDRYVAEGRRWVKKQSGDQRNRIDIDSPMPIDGETSGTSNPLSY